MAQMFETFVICVYFLCTMKAYDKLFNKWQQSHWKLKISLQQTFNILENREWADARVSHTMCIAVSMRFVFVK